MWTTRRLPRRGGCLGGLQAGTREGARQESERAARQAGWKTGGQAGRRTGGAARWSSELCGCTAVPFGLACIRVSPPQTRYLLCKLVQVWHQDVGDGACRAAPRPVADSLAKGDEHWAPVSAAARRRWVQAGRQGCCQIPLSDLVAPAMCCHLAPCGAAGIPCQPTHQQPFAP